MHPAAGGCLSGGMAGPHPWPALCALCFGSAPLDTGACVPWCLWEHLWAVQPVPAACTLGVGGGEGGAAIHAATLLVALLMGLCLLLLGLCKVCVKQGGGMRGCPSAHGLEQGERFCSGICLWIEPSRTWLMGNAVSSLLVLLLGKTLSP